VHQDLSGDVDAQSVSECSWELGVYSNLKTGIEVKFPILKVGCEYTIPLGRWVLADYQGPPPPPPGERPILESVRSLTPTTVRVRFTSYNDALSSVNLARIRIWDGADGTVAPLPILSYEISGPDVTFTTAEQTLDKYWLECQGGAVTDVFGRSNTVIQRPFAVRRIATLRMVTEDDASSPDISGWNGVSRWVVWDRWEMNPVTHAWYADIHAYDLTSGAVRRLTTDGNTSAVINVRPQVSGDTMVWEKRTVSETAVWAVNLTGGDPWILEPGAGNPQISGDWVVYEKTGGSLVAERLSTGGQVAAAQNFTWDCDWQLSDGKVALLRRDYWSDPATLEVRDLGAGVVRTIVSDPQYLSNLRMDGNRIACLTDPYGAGQAVIFDLTETSPEALVAPLEGVSAVDIWGSTVVCYAGSDLWVGDVAAQPERWILLAPPENYELAAVHAVHGADVLCDLWHLDNKGLYLLTP
jgi:hypothetical protein